MNLTISSRPSYLERVPVAALIALTGCVPALTTSVFLAANRSHCFSDGVLGAVVGVGFGVELVCLIAMAMKRRLEA